MRATLEDGSDSRGELGSTAGQRLADCLAFSASIPDGPGRWSLVVDVEVRNGCGEPVPAARAAFRVVVRGASGEILEQAVGSPDGPVAARASKRVSVDMKAPRSGVVTATSAGRPR